MKKIEELEKQYQTAKSVEDRFEYLMQLVQYLKSTDPAKGILYIEKLNQLGTESERKNIKAWYHFVKSVYATHLDMNYEDATNECNIALKLFESIEDKKGMMRSYNVLGNRCLYAGKMNDAIGFYEKSYLLSQETKDYQSESVALNNIAYIYYEQGEFEKSLEFHNLSLEIKTRDHDDWGIAFSYNNIANVYKKLGDYKLALNYYFQALKLRENCKDISGVSETYYALGNVFLEQGNYNSTLDYFQKSLQNYTSIDDKSGQSILNLAIAKLYIRIQNYDQAISYLENTIAINDKIQDKNLENVYEALGEVYYGKQDFAQAEIYFQKQLNLAIELDTKPAIISAHLNLGLITTQYSAIDQAIDSFLIAQKLAKEIELKEIYPKIYLNIANAFLLKKQYTKAEKNLQLAESFIDEMDLKDQKLNLYQRFYDLYKSKKDFESAVLFIEKRNQLQTELNKEEITKKIYSIEMLIQIEKREHEIEKIKSEVQMKNKEIQLSNYYLQQRTSLLEKLKANITELIKANAEKEFVFQSIFKQIETAYSMEEIQSNIFQERFDESNNEKINLLRTKFPNLTLAESRVAVLLSMHLSSKEIAEIIGISTRGIESHRLHIRQKMNLDRKVNLDQFIAEFLLQKVLN